MKPRALATAGFAGLAVVAAVVAGLRAAAPAGVLPAPSALPARSAATEAPAARLASSLEGTVPDGAAVAGTDDTLLLDPALVRRFDYWLSTVGERPLPELRAQVERDLDGQLRPRAARQAKDLFGRYLGFKEALRTLRPPRAASGRTVDTLRAGMQAMRSLRASWFSEAESRALFGPADAEAAAALRRMAIEQDPALAPDERRARLAALDAALPADVRAERDAPLLVTRLQDAAEQVRAQGGTEDDVYRMRAAATSPEAADRLAQLDREETEWKSRIATWQSQRHAILAAPGTDAARADALGALRASLFTPDEQRRLPAYEG